MKSILTGLFLIFVLDSFSQCSEIQISKDKFTDVVTKKTPSIIDKQGKSSGTNIFERNKKVFAPASLSYSSDSSSYLLTLAVKGKSSIFSPKGAYVLFASGEKLQFPEAYVVNQMIGDDEVYISVVKLSSQELLSLKQNVITDVRVDSFECSLDPWLGEKLKNLFGCITPL